MAVFSISGSARSRIGSLHNRLPKLGPTVAFRERIDRWLERHADVPLRMVTAPAGSGKTTAVVEYVRRRERATYCKLHRDAGTSEFLEQLAQVLSLAAGPRTYSELITGLDGVGRLELIIDEVDTLSDELVGWLAQLVVDAPESVTFVYVSRSRDLFDLNELVAAGLAAVCDDARLAFTPDEIVYLAGFQELTIGDNTAALLFAETEGWAIAVSSAMREAIASDCGLETAYATWCRKEGHHFAQFLDSILHGATTEELEALNRLLCGANIDPAIASQLEAHGFFVRYIEGRYEPYRTVRHIHPELGRSAAIPQTSADALLSVRMFGHFEAHIDGHPIPWIRRRDQQIFKYLALHPNQSCSRKELADKFWPSSDRALALQSVRTACSNLRKAISVLVGHDRVDRYLTIGSEISLNASGTVVDVRRFVAHMRDGNAAFDRGNRSMALRHYRAASALYGGRLCDGNPQEPWLDAHAATCEGLASLALRRITDIQREAGERDEASR